MAFTLLSISRLNKADHKVIFHKQMCTIKNPKGHTIATIPHSEGLYHVLTSKETKSTHAAAIKMNINEAHHKLSHISSGAIKHPCQKASSWKLSWMIVLSSEFGRRCRVRSRARHWLQLVGCAALLLDASNFGVPDRVGESGVEPRRSLRRRERVKEK